MNSDTLKLTSEVVRVGEILSASVGDELVMMSIEKGAYFGLDPVATHLWERLHQPCSVLDLCDGLVSNFEVEMDQCQQDVLEFLGNLLEQGLIEVLPPPESG